MVVDLSQDRVEWRKSGEWPLEGQCLICAQLFSDCKAFQWNQIHSLVRNSSIRSFPSHIHTGRLPFHFVSRGSLHCPSTEGFNWRIGIPNNPIVSLHHGTARELMNLPRCLGWREDRTDNSPFWIIANPTTHSVGWNKCRENTVFLLPFDMGNSWEHYHHIDGSA